MAWLAGMDEAGYGPLLGPLVVSSAVFAGPDEMVRADLWEMLHRAVARAKKGQAGRLLVTDSKKAYTRSSGISQLRRTVLAFVALLDRAESTIPTTAMELLERLCPETAGRLHEYPWYADLQTLELGGDREDIALSAGVLRRTLEDSGLSLVGLSSRCLDVGYYNRMVKAVNNKSSVLFTELCTLIQQAVTAAPSEQPLQIIVDRQGGRIDYRPSLARMFPEAAIRILKQAPLTSSYELTRPSGTMRLHFTIKADVRFLPVALASMTSKYIREVLIDAMNGYFQRHCDTLKPTAGYWQDGQRFIADLKTHLPDLKYDPDQLIRLR